MKRADLGGGLPMVICEAGIVDSIAWGADGVIVLGNVSGPLRRVSAAGGIPAPLTTLDASQGDIGHAGVYALPGGMRFLFRINSTNPARSGIYAVSLDDPTPRRVNGITQSRTFAGFVFFPQEEALIAQRLDLKKLAPVGEPFVLSSSGFSPSLSDNGVLVYRSETDAMSRFELVISDRTGKRLASFTPDHAAAFAHYEFSPDGAKLVADAAAADGEDLWILDVVKGAANRLTFEKGNENTAVWSPDGLSILYANSGGLARVQSSGAGSPQILNTTANHHKHISPDSKYLVFGVSNVAGSLVALTLDTPQAKPQPLFAGNNAQFSPDGRWLAYADLHEGGPQVFVQSWPPGNGKWQISRDGGDIPRWKGDGKELYYLRPDPPAVMAVQVAANGSAFAGGVPKALFELKGRRGPSPANRLAVTSDGQRFATTGMVETAADDPAHAMVVVNWRPPAK
jgi:hypothetical protein